MPNSRENDFESRIRRSQMDRNLADKIAAEERYRQREAQKEMERLRTEEFNRQYNNFENRKKELQTAAFLKYSPLVTERLTILGSTVFGKNWLGQGKYFIENHEDLQMWRLLGTENRRRGTIVHGETSYSPGRLGGSTSHTSSSKIETYFYKGYEVILEAHYEGDFYKGEQSSYTPYAFKVRGELGLVECGLSGKELEDALINVGLPTYLSPDLLNHWTSYRLDL